ncbi:Uncharacterised protein [Mycobacterium tuberculosis]|nr:Uncharacterised protein [Mycobacterium tuberculosis]
MTPRADSITITSSRRWRCCFNASATKKLTPGGESAETMP